MAYSTNWITHFRAVSQCLGRIGGRATCDMETGALEIRARGRKVQLLPQFVIFRPGGSIGFTQTLIEGVALFAGWRPYVNRVWPLSFDKRAFKAFCRSNGVAVPRQWSRSEDVEADVLIKRGVSSFSEGISGPYTREALRHSHPEPAEGEFFEEFIPGDIVKVWYWNATPVCLEVLPMPTVIGDGTRTLRQLINRIKVAHTDGDWSAWQATAEYQGFSLDAVVPSGRKILVEFRYRSVLHPVSPDFPNLNVLTQFANTPVMDQLQRSGEVFWRGIPEGIRQNTLFSVDGILDRAGTIRFVEINSNPSMHPDVYRPMLDGLFAVGATGRARQPAPAMFHTAAVATPM